MARVSENEFVRIENGLLVVQKQVKSQTHELYDKLDKEFKARMNTVSIKKRSG